MGKIYYKDVSYGGGGSSTLDGSIVGVEQIQKSGNLIAVISVDEDDTNIYSPLPPLIDVKVNDASVLDPVTQTAQVYTHKSLTKAEYEAIPSSVSHFSNIIYAITDEPKLYLNGIEYNGTGGGQTSVVVSPITTEGTQIASISVDGVISNIYAPNGGDEYVAGDNINISTSSGQPSTISAVDTTYSAFTSSTSGLVPSPASSPTNSYLKSDGSWSTISVGDSYIAGDNINISTFSGQPSTISAVDTTYSAFTSTAAGLVPPPTTAVDMFLKSDGTWSEAGVGNVVDVYENGVSVLDENNIAQTHSYKEITQAEYDALYPPGSTVTDNILYAIKDGEGGSGGGGASALADLNDVDISTPTDNQVLQYDSTSQKWINAIPSGGGGNVDDVYVNGISALDSNHIAQVKTHKEVTASDYNELTTEQKNDGTLYLINGTSGITVPVEDISIGKYIENASCCQNEVTEDETGVISYFYGGSQIGNDFWLLDKVDVTNYTYLKYDLELGTCYGTSNPNWYYTVGLMDSVPSDWIYAGDSRYIVKNSYTTQERSYTDETLDVSALTGEYYIIVVAHGWNATLNNIRLVSEDVQPNRIYFMDTEFANNISGGGGIKTSIFTNSSTSNPATITFSKPITDYDFITFQVRSGSNAIATMTYDTSNLVAGDTIGAGWYTGIFAWYYLTDMQTLTYRVDAGGAYISNITGIKLGGGSSNGSGITRETIWTGAVKDPNDSGILDKAISNYDYILVYGHPTDVPYEYHLDLLDVNCLLSGIANNSGFFSYEYYDTYYCRCKFSDETHFSCTGREGGGNSYYEFTKMVGIKIQNNSGGHVQETVLYTNSTTSAADIILSDDYTYYDELYFDFRRIAENHHYHVPYSYKTSVLNIGDYIQTYGYSNEYISWVITNATTFTKINDGGSWYVNKVVGIKY